jgi:TRAP-type mannitol/chloroaromatic compound transport system permease large subunit
MAAMFIVYVMVRCRINPALAPVLSDEELAMPLSEKLALLRAGIIPFLIFFTMTGLFVMGYTSLVESSAVGATSATIAAAWKRRLSFGMIHETARKTLAISCMFLWLILAALAFGAVFDGIGAVRAIESLFITRWELTPWQVIIMMQISFIIMGMFLDDTAMLVIVAPLYIPLVKGLDLGIDNQLIWFGVLYTMTCQIAYITPPFGYNLFLMRALAPKEIGLLDIYRSIWPFVLMMAATIALVMIFPQIALWLPETVKAR